METLNLEKMNEIAKKSIIWSLVAGLFFGLLSIWEIGSPDFLSKSFATTSLIFFTAILFLFVSGVVSKNKSKDEENNAKPE